MGETAEFLFDDNQAEQAAEKEPHPNCTIESSGKRSINCSPYPLRRLLIGYNTPVHNAPAPAHDDLSLFHNQLSLQAGAYQNGTWVVGVAKAGVEEGVDSTGGSRLMA